MKVKIILTVLAVIMALGLIACNTTGKEISLDLTYDDFVKQKSQSENVTVTIRDVMKITLPSNPSTGFKWELAGISDQAILVKDGESEYVLPESNAIGAYGQEIWTFKLLKRGSSIISLVYSQPWAGGTKATWTMTIGVKAINR
jgi:inhibitor of cysteine peptidase